MRVLHLNTDGWYEREGITRSVMALAARTDHEHHVVAQEPTGAMFTGLHEVAAHPSRLPWSDEIHGVLERVRPDVIHLHGGAWAPLLASARSLRRLPVIASVYSNLRLPRSHGHPVQMLIDAHGARIPALRTAAISATGVRLTRRALTSGRLRAVVTPDREIAEALGGAGPVFLAPGAASPSLHRAAWSPTPTIVLAGRAESGRGIDDLLVAFRLVRDVIPGATLKLLLLPGSAGARFRRFEAPGVEVRFDAFGALEGELARCQVAALPFRLPMTITPPLVAAEAMSVGLPVVATELSCLTAIVDETNGAVVPPRRPDLLGAALIDVLSSRRRWEALSAAAVRTIAVDWNWDRAAAGAQFAYGLLGASVVGLAPVEERAPLGPFTLGEPVLS